MLLNCYSINVERIWWLFVPFFLSRFLLGVVKWTRGYLSKTSLWHLLTDLCFISTASRLSYRCHHHRFTISWLMGKTDPNPRHSFKASKAPALAQAQKSTHSTILFTMRHSFFLLLRDRALIQKHNKFYEVFCNFPKKLWSIDWVLFYV